MTADGNGTRVPTDDQLADMLRFVARTCLEVERGLRPAAHLTSLMHPNERTTRPGQLGRFRAGPVTDDHISKPQISRVTDTRVIGTVVTRTEGDRWGALTLELRAVNGRWRVAGLQRLLAAAHYRTASATARLQATRPTQLAALAEATRMAHAAHETTSRRLNDLPPGSSGYRAALDLNRYWRTNFRDLDQQLAEYTTSCRTAERAERAERTLPRR